MNSNIGVQTVATLAFATATAYSADLRRHVKFGWSFEVISTLGDDTVFSFEAAPPSDADPCVPGAWEPVEEVPTCHGVLTAGENATVTIPAGTVAGSICAGTLPCKPNAFVRLVAESGDTADVRVVLMRQGPML